MKTFFKALLGLFLIFGTVNAATPQLIQQATNAIDSQLAREYVSAKVTPLPIINDDQFVRRAYLQIIGRIPTIAEYEQFTRINSPTKRAELVRYLVNTDGYVSNLYNYWSENLRIREKLNNTNFFNGTLYIKYVKDSIANNIPYNAFVKDLLTSKGDYYDNPSIGVYERDLGMPLDNLIANMKTFAGIDISCAQCHDDPFQDWSQIQFYKMAAMFYQAEATGKKNPAAREKIKQIRQETEEIIKNDPKQRGLNNQVSNFLSATLASVNVEPNRKLTLPHDYRYTDFPPNSVVSPQVLFGKYDIKNTEDLRLDAVDWLINTDIFTKNIVNRYWGIIFNQPLIPRIDNIYGNPTMNESMMVLLSAIYKKLNYNTKDFIQVLCSTQLFQRQSYSGKMPDQYVFIGPVMKRLSAEQMWDSILSFTVERPDYFHSEYPELYKNVMTVKDFDALKLDDVRAKLTEMNNINGKKYYGALTYKGYNLIRASEVNDLSSVNNILGQLGRGDRELIGTSSRDGNVSQVISLMNGQLVDIATKKDSYLLTSIAQKSQADKIEIIFKSILSRKPTILEKSLFAKSSDEDLIWALINTNEYKFL